MTTTKLGTTSTGKRTRAKQAEGTKLGRDLIAAMKEMIAIDRGEQKPLRVDRSERTARRLTAEPAPDFDRARVVRIRKQLGVSQPVFARALNVSPETVRAWEQGKNTPGGPAARLLEVAGEHPEWLLQKVRPTIGTPRQKK